VRNRNGRSGYQSTTTGREAGEK